MLTPENQPPFDARRDHAAVMLSHLLQKITAEVATDLACVYAYSSDLGQLEFVGAYPDLVYPSEVESGVQEVLALSIPLLANDHLCLTKEYLHGTQFECGIAFPLMLVGDVVGVIGFFHRQVGAYDEPARN